MSNTPTQAKHNIKWLHYAITALIIFGSPYIPPIAPITPLGMGVLGAFLGAIYGWSTLDMLWPSIMGILGLGLVVGMPSVLAAGFGSPVIVMLFMMFALIALLNETNATDAIASFFISNKLTTGRPWVFVFVFLLGAYVCCQINLFAAFILFSSILWELCQKMNIKPYTKFPSAMILGVTFACMNGQIMLPFKGTGITLVAAFTAMSGTQMDFGRYMLFMIPMNIFMLLCYVLVCRFILRVDVSPLKNMPADLFGGQKTLTKDQKKALGFLALVITMLILPSILPKTWPIAIMMAKLTMFGQVAIIIALMMLLKKDDGTAFFDFRKLASKGMAWDALYMTCLILPISSMLTADNTGIKAFLSNFLQPMTTLSPIVFIIAIMAFATIVTNFANNAVLAIIIMPVLYSFADQMGLNPVGMVLLLFLVTQLALATPGASPITGMTFANTDWVKSTDLMKIAIVTIAIMFIACLAVGFPWSSLIFRA